MVRLGKISFIYRKECVRYCISFHWEVTAVKQKNTNPLLWNKHKCASFQVTKISLKKRPEFSKHSVPIPTSKAQQDADYLVHLIFKLGPLRTPKGMH